MQRLLKDAEKLSGQKFDLSSYADIVDAIHVVQTEMGITGTTAKEASETISGSLASAKSAWSNLITGIADDDADFNALMDNFVGSVTTAADNIAPRIGIALNGVAKLIQEIVPVAMQYIPQIITEFFPKIAESAVGIVSSISNAILENLDQILGMGIGIVEYLKNGIIENLPMIMESASEIVLTLSGNIIELSGLLAEAAVSIIQSLIDGISQNQEMLFETIFGVVTYLAETFIEMLPQIVELGLELIASLADGIAENLPELIPTIVDVVIQIVETLIDNVDMLVDSAIAIITALAEGLINALPTLLEKAPEIVGKLVDAVIENAPKLLDSALEIITKLASGLVENFPEIVEKGKEIVDSIKQGISDAWDGLVSWFNGIWDSLFGDRSVNVNANVSTNGSHAGGLSYVPFDGYIAELHKGERVLTASEARAYNDGYGTGGSGGITVVQNIQSVPMTPVELAATTKAYFQRARWALA